MLLILVIQNQTKQWDGNEVNNVTVALPHGEIWFCSDSIALAVSVDSSYCNNMKLFTQFSLTTNNHITDQTPEESCHD